jgi:UDP-N-acetylmuramoylalanine--D-glutamate ligase
MPPAAPAFLSPLLDRPVAVLGGAVSGAGARDLLAALGAEGVIYDRTGVEFTDAAAALHRLAVYSPGFFPGHPWLVKARAAGCRCLGEIDFASLFWRGRLIAVTGTNGKTTLTEFLCHALTSTGRRAVAAGNVGRSFSGLAAAEGGGSRETIAVCEVSSFQAETLHHFRAEATLWTNFAEDHLERHAGMEAYFAAKAVLAGRSDRVFAGSSVRAFAESLARRPPSKGGPDPAIFFDSEGDPTADAIWVRTEGLPGDPGLTGTAFSDYPQRENFVLAAAWWRAADLGVPALYAAARSFRLGRHRLAHVAELDGVTYWNDSKATNFHAVEGALPRFKSPVLLIAGGKGKGGDLPGFVRRIAPRVRHLYLIGETAGKLSQACAEAGVAHSVHGSLSAAVHAAAGAAQPGDHVLLSPAFASFDMFSSYADRGDQFEQLVRELGAAPVRPV